MVRRDDMHCLEWPLGKITRNFPDHDGVVRTVEVEEGGQRSMHSVAFIVPLELDCKEAEAITPYEERDDYTEGEEEEEAAEITPSPVPSDIENGSADQQPALDELSQTPTNEGDVSNTKSYLR